MFGKKKRDKQQAKWVTGFHPGLPELKVLVRDGTSEDDAKAKLFKRMATRCRSNGIAFRPDKVAFDVLRG